MDVLHVALDDIVDNLVNGKNRALVMRKFRTRKAIITLGKSPLFQLSSEDVPQCFCHVGVFLQSKKVVSPTESR